MGRLMLPSHSSRQTVTEPPSSSAVYVGSAKPMLTTAVM